MLAVDELDLGGGEERLGAGVIQARPSAALPPRPQLPSVNADLDK
jgi:hypothetical protein